MLHLIGLFSSDKMEKKSTSFTERNIFLVVKRVRGQMKFIDTTFNNHEIKTET